MITRIEALNYRCLRYIRQDLGPFHVLVGPNASGKTTFLDVIAFLGRLLTDGPEAAVVERTQNFEDLVWGRRHDRFELAIEAAIPENRRPALEHNWYDRVRYEIALGTEPDEGGIYLLEERVLLKVASAGPSRLHAVFPARTRPPKTILTGAIERDTARFIIKKFPAGNDLFTREGHKGWFPALKLGPRKSALASIPADESTFPVATWLKDFLLEGVQEIALDSQSLRRASPPLGARGFRADGSNLPWLIDSLRRRSAKRFREWISHLQTALPDLESIRTVERPEDKHRYLVIGYRDGLEVPSWVASDGTLRLLALSLPAYLSDFSGVYLIEEPENGIHPRAVETMFQSLSSVYDAQILMATHSPVILSLADASIVLCFAKTEDEATDIVLGSEHPALRDWHGESNLGVLFAAGVLG
jgi:predicted ATPase